MPKCCLKQGDKVKEGGERRKKNGHIEGKGREGKEEQKGKEDREEKERERGEGGEGREDIGREGGEGRRGGEGGKLYNVPLDIDSVTHTDSRKQTPRVTTQTQTYTCTLIHNHVQRRTYMYVSPQLM